MISPSQQCVEAAEKALQALESSRTDSTNAFQAVINCNTALLSDPGNARALAIGQQVLDIVAFNEHDPNFHMLKGRLLQNEGLMEQAARSFLTAGQLYKERWLVPQGMYDMFASRDALSAIQMGAKLSPENVGALTIYSHELFEQERWPEAEAVSHHLNEQHSDIPLFGTWYANFLIAVGKNDEALAVLERTIEAHPDYLEATAMLARVPGYDVDGKTIDRFTQALSKASSPVEKVLVHFALGQMYRKLGDIQKSFEHYQAGNKAEAEMIGWRGGPCSTDTAFCENLCGIYGGKGEVPSYNAENLEIARFVPIIIVGLPRSGTSLVHQILASYKDENGECPVQPAGESDHLSKFHRAIEAVIRSGHRINAGNVAQIGKTYYDSLISQFGIGADTTHVVTKFPFDFAHLDKARMFLPNAKIIHCRRDPGATGCSIYFRAFSEPTLGWTSNLADIGDYITSHYDPIMDLWRGAIPSDQLLEVDYEQIVREPAQEIGKMLRFAGLPENSSCLDFHKAPIPSATEPGVHRPLDSTKIDGWRDYEAHLSELIGCFE